MKLDLSTKTAHVKPVDVKYYTSIREHTDIYVVGGSAAYPTPEVSLFPPISSCLFIAGCYVVSFWVQYKQEFCTDPACKGFAERSAAPDGVSPFLCNALFQIA